MKISHETKKFSDLLKIRDEIHLNPIWQRGAVWSQSKQALLIDSILRGYDIPMIYLRHCSPSATYKYEVVDGQQRLRSLWEFIDGGYALPTSYEKIGVFDIADKTFSDLPKALQSRISNFRVVIAYVKNAGEPEISRLFSRMQMGVRLNPAELRNAVQTGLRHAVDGVARVHNFFINSRINSARFKYQDYLAHVVSGCLHSIKLDVKAKQLMDDYLHVTDANIYAPVMADADDILDFLAKVNSLTSKRIKQKWIFVDLYFLLYQNKGRLGKLCAKDFARTYVEFDNDRLTHNAEPEKLLSGTPTEIQTDLYDYIRAFNISGAERKNLQQRNQVLTRRFNAVLEV
ncbi:DUF262 domain-containing protein [Pseudomonadota bacterium]